MTEKTILNVEGMTCSNCAQGISRFLEKKGMKGVRVDFSSGEVVFEEVNPENRETIISGINNLGYKVIEDVPDNAENKKSFRWDALEVKFFISVLFTLPLLLHMFVHIEILNNPWMQLLLCLPVFVIGLMHFGKSAWGSVKTGVPNMDVLITLGSVSAFGYSLAGLLLYNHASGNFLFFETAATIITLVLLGNIIEKNSVKKTTTAIRDLASLQPVNANKITVDHHKHETITLMPAVSIKKGDAVLINSGGAVPVDGKIYWGNATIDEAALTGESIPVDKSVGDSVLAGSVLLSGSLKVTTEKPANQTVLANVVNLVKEALHSKPVIQKLGDKVSAWFVPAVLLIAFSTFIISYFFMDKEAATSLMNAVAVLVISCPCAMGLATPTAVAVGLGKAARSGIIVKGGATLELFDSIKTAVFDKTGTLTTGNFKITSLNVYDFPKQEAIDIIYSLEQHSNHPIALSLVKELTPDKSGWVALHEPVEQKGLGITAVDASGNHYSIGSMKFKETTYPDALHNVYLTKNNVLIATVDIKDEIKPGAPQMISDLKTAGITPVLLSGDNEIRCNEVAQTLGISKVFSGKLPHEKSAVIQELKKEGKLVMIGDGINDGPSLAIADLGVSFGEASKIAINSAQVIIMNNNDMQAITRAFRIGKLTMRTIKQNLFWAFFYNIVAIPVAAMGFLSPMVAAFSMAFSDVIVIGNSIRLKFKK